MPTPYGRTRFPDRPAMPCYLNVKWTRCGALDSGVHPMSLSRQALWRTHNDDGLDFGSMFKFHVNLSDTSITTKPL